MFTHHAQCSIKSASSSATRQPSRPCGIKHLLGTSSHIFKACQCYSLLLLIHTSSKTICKVFLGLPGCCDLPNRMAWSRSILKTSRSREFEREFSIKHVLTCVAHLLTHRVFTSRRHIVSDMLNSYHRPARPVCSYSRWTQFPRWAKRYVSVLH